jgi:RNase P subunit RPR2
MKIQIVAIAYRCPACSKDVMGEVDLFELGGEGTSIPCDCGESEVSLMLGAEGKIKISIPCLFCPESHRYQLAGVSFFERDLFTLACKYTSVDIVFMGDPTHVLNALEESEKQLIEMFREAMDEAGEEEQEYDCSHDYDWDEGRDQHYQEEKSDEEPAIPQPTGDLIDACANPTVTMNLMYLVKEFAQDQKIRCDCGKEGYNLQLGYDHIQLTCPHCGGVRRINSVTENDLYALADQDEIRIRR